MADELDTASAVSRYLGSRSPADSVRASLSLAAGVNPDEEAEFQRLSRESGIPVDSVRDNKAAVQQRLSLPDPDTLATRFPSTTQYLSDLNRARVAHDDVGNLTDIEATFRQAQKQGRAVQGKVGETFTRPGSRRESGGRVGEVFVRRGEMQEIEPTVMGGIFNLERVRAAGAGFRIKATDVLGMEPGQAIQEYRDAKRRSEVLDPEIESATGQGIYRGLQSTVDQAAGIALSLFSRSPVPALAVLGGQSFGESYGKYRERGGTVGEANLGAALEAGTEVATEALPMGFLVKRLGRVGAGEFLAGMLAREIPSEQIATIVQDAVDTAIANPDKTWDEYLAERPGAAYQTLVATVTQGGVMASANTLARKILGPQEEAQQSEATAAAAERLVQLAEASKLRQRDPQAFKAFIEQVAQTGEGPAEFYVDAEQLANTLNQGAVTLEELRAVAPEMVKQLEAAVPGADIRVPVGEFTAAPANLTTALLDHLRESPEAMSRAEAQAFLKEEGARIQQEVESVLTDEASRVARREAQQAAQQVFEEQLAATGQFRPEVNKAYAQVLGAFYATQAERSGVTVEEFLDRYRLRVQGKNAKGPLGSQQTLEQRDEITRTPQFRQWFKASAAVDDAGKPKVLYHGTRSDFSVFERSQGGKTTGAGNAKLGFFFTDRSDVAGRYARMGSDQMGAQNVMPVFLAMQNPVRLRAQNMMEADKLLEVEFRPKHDGAIIEVGEGDSRQTVYMVRNPEQIKSAFNGGQFDPNDPNILNQRSKQTSIPRDSLADEGGKNAALLHALVEGARLHAKELADVLEGAPLPPEFDGISELPTLLSMQAAVLAVARNDLEILRTVVRTLPVDVVDDFTGGQGSPEDTLRNHPMLQNGAALDADLTIAFLRDGADPVALLIREEARAAAEVAGISLGPRLEAQEGGAAMGAGEGNSLGQGGTFPRATLSFGNDITSVPSIISLLEGSDLSSFLHESGHWFLEVQADLAQRIQRRTFNERHTAEPVSDSEREIVADFARVLDWFGIKDTPEQSALDTWASMTLEEKREHHEKFARGFEKYLGEGRAPSQELQGIFGKFRAWLLNVYKALRNLDVDLSDDVRAVMDRMLATDDAIAEAEAARNMGPLFASPEQAGMTPEQFAEYQALGAQQTAEAASELDAKLMRDMKWLSRARDKAIKARQQEVDDLRREVRLEISREVMASPVYQVWQVLTGKGDVLMPGVGAVITPQSNIKLRTKFVKEISAEAWSRLSERRMTSEERGWDPDIVAELFGFTSGHQLVQDLARVAPPQQVIDEMTDRAMLERYGDIASPAALQRAADEAVHNEVRARVVATELKALEKASKVRERAGRSTVDVLARAAKDYAYAIIAGQRVRDLRPSQYSAAQARSAKLASQALGKSTEEAAMHKRNELINGYAARAAYDAQEEVRAMQRYFRRFDKRPDGVDPGYLDQIEALLERYDFRVTNKETDRRKSFRAWYDEQLAAGNAPDVPDSILEDSARKSYRDMTVEELRGLRDTIKQIEHQGRLKKKLLLAKDARDFDAIATEVEASIIEHGGEPRDVELEGPNPVTDWFAGVWASHRKLASLIRQMDGNRDDGPLWKFIGQPMNERDTMEQVMLEQATEKLRALYAPLLKMRGGVTGKRSAIYIPEIRDSLTRGGRLAVALNWGNEANRQRLADGNGWSVDQVQAVLKTLSAEELAFVNGVWEFLDSYWPEIAAKEKRLTGVEPPKVEALPFTVMSADGVEVKMTGGYHPLKYDTNASDRAQQQEAAQAAKEMMQGAFTRATTRRGHTKERLKEVKRKVRLDLNVITQHVTQVAHDLAWHEFLIDTNKLLGDERIAGAIREHYGPRVLQTIRDDILGIATADVVPMDSVDKALLMLRSNVTRATMGASLTTAFLQPFGLTQSMVRIGARHVLRGMARWGGDAVRMESTLSWIYGKSEFMRLRAKTFNRDLREIRGSVGGKSAVMQAVDGGLFFLMRKMQLVADVPTWVGQYEKSRAEGLAEADAVAMADRAVLDSQGGGSTKDMAEVQRKHPMLTQFYSYFSTTLNLVAEQTAATDFRNPRALAGWLGDMALLMVIPAILPSMILYGLKGGGEDDDEEKLAKHMLQWQLSYLLGTVVLARELSGSVSGFDYAGPPVGRLAVDLTRAGKQTVQGEVDEPLVLAYINLVGTALGIPTTQLLRSYKGWKAWDEGEEGAGPQSILFGPPPKD